MRNKLKKNNAYPRFKNKESLFDELQEELNQMNAN
jgi:hypothetical protein